MPRRRSTTKTDPATLLVPSHSPVIVGIDWADREHVVCVLDGDQVQLQRLRQQPQAIADWVAELRLQAADREIRIALEQSRGALIYALLQFPDLVLYPVNPKQLARFREALVPSGSKDDPGDAHLLAQLLLHHEPNLRAWRPDDPATRQLGELAQYRRQFVDRRTRLTQQLGALLKEFFPLVVELWRGKLHQPLVVELLQRWPALHDLQRARLQSVRRFLADHGIRHAERQSELMEAFRAARPLTTDPALLQPRALAAQALAGQIAQLNQHIARFEEQLEQAVAQHADAPLFQSCPGAGEALVPRLIAAFGADRTRFADASEIQTYCGIAPVTKQSGKKRVVSKRQACPKFLRQTFHEFADQARKWSDWSRAFYQYKRANGMAHHAILRALAYKWIRILFQVWQTRTPYSEAAYQQQLRLRNSPILKFLEPA